MELIGYVLLGIAAGILSGLLVLVVYRVGAIIDCAVWS